MSFIDNIIFEKGRCYCIQSIYTDLTKTKNIIRVGDWYNYLITYHKDAGYNVVKLTPKNSAIISISKHSFESNFIKEDEYREQQINKVISVTF